MEPKTPVAEPTTGEIINAQTAAAAGGTSIWFWVILGVLLAALAIAILVLVMANNKKRPASHGQPGYPPQPPQPPHNWG